MTKEAFFTDAKARLEIAAVFIESHDLQDELSVDHICYKCGSHEEFVTVRAMLEFESIYLYESWINGRLIAILRLREPIMYQDTAVMYIELQDKKEDKEVIPGFTHIEYFPKTMSVREVADALIQKGIEVVDDPTPHHPVYEVALADNFTFRLEPGLVIEKVKREEMI